MSFRFLTLLLLICCCYFVGAAKQLTINGKSYTAMAYPQDCRKYMLCTGEKKCELKSCSPTYVFDPVKSVCTHDGRESALCAQRSMRL